MTASESTILVVEDEAFLRDSLVEFLGARGYDAAGAGTKQEADRMLEERNFRLLLLDINLPDGNGLAVARRLRERSGLGVGIIVLTCRGTVADRVTGLDSGADAYLVKDADLLEIDATIRSVLRRLPQPAGAVSEPSAVPARAGEGWHLPPNSPVLQTPHGTTVVLTPSEHAFLISLLQRPGEPVSRAEIAQGMDRMPNWTLRNLDSLVRRLRHKVKAADGAVLPVRMVYGRGYSLEGSWSNGGSAVV